MKVFVSIPYALADVRDLVEHSVDKAPFCQRLDWTTYLSEAGSLAEAVVQQIRSTDVLIIDVSIPNQNVALEAGAALALGKKVVSIAREGRSIPHHFSALRSIIYENLVDLESKLDDLLMDLHQGQSLQIVEGPNTTVTEPRRRLLTDIPGDPASRVFVGGNYREQFAILLELRAFVGTVPGWTPILANDFEMPRDRTRQESLRLLHNCDFAIFDITSEGGQVVEIENAPTYNVDFLLVYNTMDLTVPN